MVSASVIAGAPIDAAAIRGPSRSPVPAEIAGAAIINRIAAPGVAIAAVGVTGIDGRVTTSERDSERRNDCA
jgi:hypothetical protein